MNPYSSPISDGPPLARDGHGGDDVVTPRILAAMSETRPWVTFLAVLGFIGAAFMVIAAFGLLLSAPAGVPGGRLFGLIYVIPALLYGVGANILFRYRGSIRALQAGYGVEALENALEHQKSFWRFTGLCMAVTLGIYAVGLVIAVVIGASAAMM
ncbi:MAG: hypothetical protein ACRBN8_33640 [Nannocystales bacterium]